MYGKKWYLNTWFISLMFIAWILILPPIIGIILLIMQYNENKKLNKKYGKIDQLDMKIQTSENTYDEKYKENEFNLSKQLEKHNNIITNAKNEIENLTTVKLNLLKELEGLNTNVILSHYNFSDYEGISSEECKNKLSLIKIKEQDLIKNNNALKIISGDLKRVINNNIKQILRCFNSECDNVIKDITFKNIDSMRNKIQKSYDSLNKIFETDGISISSELLELKLEELNLVYTYELKREQEREQQKAIKEQMIEEEKVRREIENEKSKIEKEESQFNNEVKKLMLYLQKTDNDIEKNIYLDKIKELENKLNLLAKDKESISQREANTRAGFVYVISNIGSFGDDVYKIGMTRRLEPMDRIKELGSASVPFDFDVHAMIFSDDAPTLETKLHERFRNQSVNKINLRKEFFKVSLSEIEKFVTENYNATVEFTKLALAEEYRQSLNMALTA